MLAAFNLWSCTWTGRTGMFLDKCIPLWLMVIDMTKVAFTHFYVAHPLSFAFAANCLQLQWRSVLSLLISYSAPFNSMPEMLRQWCSWSRYIEHPTSILIVVLECGPSLFLNLVYVQRLNARLRVVRLSLILAIQCELFIYSL